MGKGKLAKFDDLSQMPHVFQNFSWSDPQLINYQKEAVNYNGRWATDFFQNGQPIILELACGYGEYTMAMAEHLPNHNIIGVDIKGNRIWTGARYIQEKQLTNAAFVRTTIDLIHHFFGAAEISEIWIPFPDPHNRHSKQNKRLTSPKFLELYRKILMPDGVIHLKTDSDLLYKYTLEVVEKEGCTIIENYRDLYNSPFANPLLSVSTRYERLNISGADTIKYVQFRLGQK